MNKNRHLSQEDLRRCVDYDAATGEFIWVERRFKRTVGAPAGSVSKKGYRVITINGRIYLAHRLAFLYMTGEWPKAQIDHIDGIKHNNSWDNLRGCVNSQNLMNRGKQKNNRSGLKGVSWSKTMKAWSAEITANGKRYKLGYSDCRAAASFMYQIEADKLHRQFARTF